MNRTGCAIHPGWCDVSIENSLSEGYDLSLWVIGHRCGAVLVHVWVRRSDLRVQIVRAGLGLHPRVGITVVAVRGALPVQFAVHFRLFWGSFRVH